MYDIGWIAQLLIFLRHTNLNFMKDLVFTRTDILTLVGFYGLYLQVKLWVLDWLKLKASY